MNYQTMQENIKEIFGKYKSNIAAEYGDKTYTYSEIDGLSDAVARHILTCGVTKGAFLGVLMNDKVNTIIAIIGILKAGCVFVPLDGGYPTKRLEAMINVADIEVIFTDSQDILEKHEFFKDARNELSYMVIDEKFYIRNRATEELSGMDYDPEAPLYVYFTSGTTGEPKAIVGKNKSLVHFIDWEISTFNIDSNIKISQFTSQCHDPYLRDIFVPLLSGGRLCIPEKKEIILETKSMMGWIERTGVNLIHCTPSLFKVFNSSSLNADNFMKLTHILLAGEKIPPQELSNWYSIFGERIQLVNLYGPTETTLAKFFYLIKPSDVIRQSIPVGKPISGTRAVILDENMKLCAKGVMGEIYIRTPYMSLGYYKNEELTNQKFIRNPFGSDPNDFIFKTGDLGRLLKDDNIEFLGRIDRQVKIRGFRVELNDIENTIYKHEGVKEAVVASRESGSGDITIHAYVVPKQMNEEPGDEANKELISDISEYLTLRLMDYMLPRTITVLDRIPVTANGKIDYNALPEPKENEAKSIKLPSDEVEEKLLQVWRDILGVEMIGVDVEFLKAGGHSLNAMNLISRVHQEFDVEIHLGQIFEGGSIEKLAQFIRENTSSSAYNSINTVDEKEYYLVSSAQKRLYVLNQLSQNNTSYNLPGVMLVEGHFDIEAFQNAVRQIIRRHESFRTSFEIVDGEIIQRIHENVEFNINYSEASEDRIKYIAKEFVQPFDLGKAPLLRISFFKTGDMRHVMMLDMHHIISDGTSMGLFIKELLVLTRGERLEPLKVQYKDFAQWQKETYSKTVLKAQEEFWLQEFKEDIPVLDIQTDFPRPALQSFEGDRIFGFLDNELKENLNMLAVRNGVTLYMIMLSCYNVLLHKYTGQEDIVVGTPVMGRNHADLQDIIGVFVNTVALRNYPSASKTFMKLLLEIKENTLRAFENQEYQFEELIEKVGIKRDMSRNPLFDTMLVLQNMYIPEIAVEGLRFREYPGMEKTSKFDITTSISESDNGINIEMEYCTALFKKDTIERFLNNFVNLLKVVVSNPEICISDIDIMSQKERDAVLYKYNATEADYPSDKTMHQLFEEQAEKTPDNIALLFEGNYMTYKELNEKSNCVAHLLREKGVTSDSLVGLSLHRSFEMMIGIMGILKAGGAYMPISPDYPIERVKYIMKDSGSGILLTKRGVFDRLEDGILEFETIDLEKENIYLGNNENPPHISSPKNIMYVIYTSGSTGNPKGVMIEHASAVNTTWALQCDYPLLERDVYLQKTNFTFDVSVAELFGWFFEGGKLAFLSPEAEKVPEKIMDAVKEYGVTHMNFVPSMLGTFLNIIKDKDLAKFDTVKYVFSAGEALELNVLKNFYSLFGKTTLVNLYGPTEATIYATGIVLDKDCRSISIGKPLANFHTYIVGKNNEIQPLGVAGELCLAGVGLARGYLNKQELTDEKFISSRFLPKERIYKTGDLARLMPDGSIEYMGRIDNQVKVRGFRIELGEIENSLREHSGIIEAVVKPFTDSLGDKYLCAYYVSETEITISELRKHLLNKLPEYMLPSYFIRLEKMPRTSSGKIDRKQLSEPQGEIDTGVLYEAPSNETEEKMVLLWEKILGRKKIGINDNFFDLGGHSLRAAILAAEIHKEFGAEIPLFEVFKLQTVKNMSGFVNTAGKSLYKPIIPVGEMEYYPVSPAQKRLYILDQMMGDNTIYDLPFAILIEGRFDLDVFNGAINELVKRHESLRTSFTIAEGQIVQKIEKSLEYKVEYMEAREEDAEKIIKEFVKPFDLSKAPLFRICLVKIGHDRHILLQDMHHIIYDGVSLGVFIRELLSLCRGKELEPVKIQYKDFSVWQNEMYTGEVLKKQEEYWLEKFSGEIPVLDFPTDYPRPPLVNSDGNEINIKLDGDLDKKLGEIARKNGATLYMVLLAAYNVLLNKYTGQEDFIIGTPVAGRNHSDLQEVIGMFVNTIVLRNFPEGQKSFIELLDEVKLNTVQAFENQDYQFEELIDKVGVKRDLSRNPLFDTMFSYENMDMPELKMDGLSFKPYMNISGIAKFDLTLRVTETEETKLLWLEYSTSLFKHETAQRILNHYVNVLREITGNPEVMIKDVDIISADEKKALLENFNNTAADYPQDKTIHQLFEEQVERTPDNIAAVFEGNKLTYKELNEKANRLAATLRNKGVKPDSIVALALHRSLEMIIGIMGVLKAGGAYLPISPEYPSERIAYILEDSGAGILLTQQKLLESLSEIGGFETLVLEDQSIYTGDGSNLEMVSKPHNLAYVIYTSGSTGKPKGALLEHHSLVNRLNWMQKKYPIGTGDVILQKTPYTFDVSVWELLWWSLTGAEVCFLEPGGEKDPSRILKAIRDENVTVMHFVPSMLSIFLEYVDDGMEDIESLKSLKTVFASGEALTPQQANRFNRLLYKRFGTKLHNLYGPTEAAIDVSYFDCSTGAELDLVPIGKPIDNIKLFVLGKNNELKPLGVPGELHISGAGLARGYLGRPELTGEKFIKSPFKEGERLYKTGDLVRLLSDGNIEYLGRLDYQVKIRGFRIELGEIENLLSQYGPVKEAVVMARKDADGDRYLCAYVTAERELNVSEIREYLSRELPDYMVPSYFVQLGSMPLSQNGKIDRKALPEPDAVMKTGVEYVAPTDEIEERLEGIWRDILGVERAGIHDNFFEVGGHSLKATILSNRIFKEFNTNLPLMEIFKKPTISEQAKYIRHAGKDRFLVIDPVDEKEYYDLSAVQKRMYIIDSFEGIGTSYNMPITVMIQGTPDVKRMKDAMNILMKRHEALRTSFHTINGAPVQKVHDEVKFEIALLRSKEDDIDNTLREFVKRFDLAKAPLMRIGLVEMSPGKHIMIFDMHHIISDGVSMGIITSEFIKLYNGMELPELKVQYKDFANWQNEMFKSDVIKKQENYWLEQFADEIPVIDLPLDFERPEVKSYEGDVIKFEINEDLTGKVRRFAKEHGATLYMVILAGYTVLLSKYGGQEDVIVGSPIAGRTHPDLHNVMGVFLNTLAMRNKPSADKTVEQFIAEVRENALNAYQNQDYQFEDMVEKLNIKHAANRNPLFDTMFIMQNAGDDAGIEMDGISFIPYEIPNRTAKFDIKVEAVENEKQIDVTLDYCIKLFKRSTMEKFAEHLTGIIEEMVTNPEEKLKNIEIHKEEKNELLAGFNEDF